MAVKLIINNNQAVLSFDGVDNNKTESNVDEILKKLKSANCKIVYAKLEENVKRVSSALIEAEIYDISRKVSHAGISFNYEELPETTRLLISMALKPSNIPPAQDNKKKSFLTKIGEDGYRIYGGIKHSLSFMYEIFLSIFRFFSGRAVCRRKDFWFIFADCGYKAVGITALVSFLVGLILAFVGALQLKNFGAGIYVASMVALGMTRIMAAIMVGIIMAGRTGSSFAATLGTMQVNEELDALKTLGVRVTDYLVAPRTVALVLTIPFLTMLADVLGIFGGAVVGICFLDLTPSAYFDYSVKALDLTNTLVGLLHSLIYGIIISVCGCYEGINAGRDADAVGKATTGAVVSSLVWMIVATGILTVILEVIGI